MDIVRTSFVADCIKVSYLSGNDGRDDSEVESVSEKDAPVLEG
jgi:hypothetical protein